MREVSHYLETGKMRKRASKTKEQGSNNLEVGQDSVSVSLLPILFIFFFVRSRLKLYSFASESQRSQFFKTFG